MPEKKFALEPGGAKHLGVSWRGAYKDLSVSVDDQTVARFGDPKELKGAQPVALPDGSTLEVQVASPFLIPELLLTRNGEPVPGSAGDPTTRHAAAWQMVAAVAVLNVVIGLLVEATGADFLRGIGAGWPSVFTGLLYGVLAWFVRGRSLVALGIAVGLFVLDGVLVIAATTQASGVPNVGGLMARVFFLIPMVRGFPATRDLARPRRRPLSPRSLPPRPVSPRPAARPARPPASSTERTAAPAPSRVLTGEAERQRLQMSRVDAAPAPKAPRREAISIKAQASVDAAAAALRFLARKCEIGEAGLQVTTRDGRPRDVPWNVVGRIVARQLPPDPPWEAGLLVDVVAWLDGRWEPIRLFTTTLVNFAALGGEASTSRAENLRRLARHLRERQPAVAIDDETLAFVEGKPPARFASMSQFVEYDATYGAAVPA